MQNNLNRILTNSNVNWIPLFKFTFLNCLKSSLWIAINIIIVSIIMPFTFFMVFKYSWNGLYENYIFFLVGLNYLVISLAIPSSIIFLILAPQRFSDLQSRIALLGFKKVGYLLIIVVSCMIYALISQAITTIVYVIEMTATKTNAINVFNWPLVFYFIGSLLFVKIFTTIFLLITTIMPSVKSIELVMFAFYTIPIVVSFQIFSILPAITTNTNILKNSMLSKQSLIWYFTFIILEIILSGIIFTIFEKNYSWKK